ncbi:MAG: hypothetical protein GY768_07570 [Planctomycetaceae bacterium]|nr:hypothetical protein [Planctomycetaceae bacterium]
MNATLPDNDTHEEVYTLFEPLRKSLQATRQFGPISRLATRVIAGLNAYPEDAVDETFATERIAIVGNAATALLQLRQTVLCCLLML